MKGIVGQVMTNNLCSLLAGPLTGNDTFAHLPATTVADQMYARQIIFSQIP